MENLSADLVIYLISLAASWGGVMARIKTLEKKMDKHNSLGERLTVIEERAKGNTRRIENLERSELAQ